MTLEERIHAFARLGYRMASLPGDQSFAAVMESARHQNAWFTAEQVLHAIGHWSRLLTEQNIHAWMQPYGNSAEMVQPRKIGVVNAGNIPLVGFHDFMSVLITGHRYLGKNASDDKVLLPYMAKLLAEEEPRFEGRFSFIEKLSGFDAVIATGSNNTARYFEYYFGKYPHIIRKNRNGVAILSGKEGDAELEALGEDVFRYFGLGCRNVSCLMLPDGYDLPRLFGAFEKYANVGNHHKYNNNYEYYRAVLALKKIHFYDNGFLIVKKDEAIATPISILNYSFYHSPGQVKTRLEERKENIQCIISSDHIPFGQSQSPALNDYADGVDTVDFLLRVLQNQKI